MSNRRHSVVGFRFCPVQSISTLSPLRNKKVKKNVCYGFACYFTDSPVTIWGIQFSTPNWAKWLTFWLILVLLFLSFNQQKMWLWHLVGSDCSEFFLQPSCILKCSSHAKLQPNQSHETPDPIKSQKQIPQWFIVFRKIFRRPPPHTVKIQENSYASQTHPLKPMRPIVLQANINK